jgi:uncharacterized cupredoxin-like copper-binding protein
MSEIRQAIRLKRCHFPADGVEVLLFQEREAGKLEAAEEIRFVPCNDREVSHNMAMSMSDAEQLMADLWEAGVRIPQVEESRKEPEEARHEVALRAHLEDLRTICTGLIACLKRGN